MKLKIEGKVVKVDDSFKSLSPEEQQETVNDIARQMRGENKETSYGDMALSAAGGVADTLTASHTDKILAGITGGNAEDYRAKMDQLSRDNPGSNLLGSIAGGFVPVAGIAGRAGAAVRGGASMAGQIAKASATGAATGAAYGVADQHGRTGELGLEGAKTGAIAGAVAGPVGIAASRLLSKNKHLYGDKAREGRADVVAGNRVAQVEGDPTRVPRGDVDTIRRQMRGDSQQFHPMDRKVYNHMDKRLAQTGVRQGSPATPAAMVAPQPGPVGPWNAPQYRPGTPNTQHATVGQLWKDKVAINDKVRQNIAGNKSVKDASAARGSMEKGVEKVLRPAQLDKWKGANDAWSRNQAFKLIDRKISKMTSVDDIRDLVKDPGFMSKIPKKFHQDLYDELSKASTTKAKVLRLLKQMFYFANPSTAMYNMYRHPAIGAGNAGAMIGTKALSAANLRAMKRRLGDKILDDMAPNQTRVLSPNAMGANAFAGMAGAGLQGQEN
jgi:hypothetical protein